MAASAARNTHRVRRHGDLREVDGFLLGALRTHPWVLVVRLAPAASVFSMSRVVSSNPGVIVTGFVSWNAKPSPAVDGTEAEAEPGGPLCPYQSPYCHSRRRSLLAGPSRRPGGASQLHWH